MRKLNAREVRREFRIWWRQRCADVPAYLGDEPARRQAFGPFVDSLWQLDRISDGVHERATLEGR